MAGTDGKIRGSTRSWMTGSRLVYQAVCLFLAIVFLVAGLAKIRQPYDFLSSLYAYRLFSAEQGRLIAMLIPPLEIVVGASLLMQTCQRGGLIMCTLLSSAFVCVRMYAVQTGNPIDCNCFGTQVLFPAKTMDWWSVGMSVLQLAATLVGLVLGLTEPWSARTPEKT